jgi:FAD/FMN-containing dehydrogenase
LTSGARSSRRGFLAGALATANVLACTPLLRTRPAAAASPVVNDVTRLNPVAVSRVDTPRSTDEVRRLIRDWAGSISIGGGRYSMGGQIAAPDSLHLDMRRFNHLIGLDTHRKTVRVQTGMRWRDLQTLIDPHGLAVKIMQSYANFTIGGALSVNAHGRYVGLGSLINAVRGIEVILPGGIAIKASPLQEAELFYGAIGGYGALGVITEVELDLVPNVPIERRVHYLPMVQYPDYFRTQILSNPDTVLHNADLAFPRLDQAVSVTWFKTDKPVTVAQRLIPADQSYGLDAAKIWALAELPGGHAIRRSLVEPIEYGSHPVVWRNHEASRDVASLGPIATDRSTYALQEYFVPVTQCAEFAQQMSRILGTGDVNALNVSVRHSPTDPGSLLAWAREEVFSFVLYYKQRTSPAAQEHVGHWTRKLIDAALRLGGTYYLPYQLHATKAQFDLAYPGAEMLFALKAKADPRNQFRNKLWDKYATT